MTATASTTSRELGPTNVAARHASASAQSLARNRGRIAGGAALIVASALAAVMVYGNVGQRVPVLAAARAVDPGQVITDADLKVVNVGADRGVATVAAARRSEIVGKRATTGLLPGSLLGSASIVDGPVVPSGSTL